MSVVAKIIYVSRKLSPGVSPGAQQLFLYDKNNNLLWVGTTAAITMAALNRRVWSATFEKGVASGETAPTFSDTTTASIRAIVRRQVDVTPSIEFTYDSREYTVFLTDYNGEHYESGAFDYYIWTPYATDNTDMPTYNLAYVREVTNENSNWNVSRPVVSAETVSPGTAIDVVWSAPTPTPVDPNTSETIVSSTIYLEYSTNSNMTGATTVSLTGTSGTKSLTGLAKERTYYFRVTGEWTSDDPDETSNEFSSASDISSATTITPLGTPVINSVAALDGEGSVSWSEITGAVSYLVALVDAENDVPTSSVSQGGTTWSFNESSGMTVQGKWVRVKAVATSNSIEYENSEWSAARLIPDNRTPADEEPTTPVEQIMTRRIYKAIPYIDVPVEQIGGGGSSMKDAITVEYADAHYAAIGDAITPSTLPIATDDELGAIKVGSHLSIDSDTGVLSVSDSGAIASGNTGLVTGGTVYTETSKYAAFANKSIATSVSSGNSNPVTSGAVYTFVTTVSNLPKAKAAGGADNAGVVYVTSASDKEGLIIDGTNAGQIKVDFAGTSSVSWSSTVANKVANPLYVKKAFESFIADTTKVTATGGSGKGGMIVKLDANGFIDGSMLKVVSVTNYFEAASQAAMLALSDAQDGDICVRTDESETYILMSGGAANGYATASNWKKLTTPTGTVTSVNGKAGAAVTLNLTDIYANGSTKASIDTSISTDAISTENYHFPTSKAVQGYVTSKITALNLGGAATYSVATWTSGTTKWDTGGTGLVTANYLKSAITDYGFGDAAKKGVATEVTSSGTDLPTAAAVYTAISNNINNLDYTDVGAAAEIHYHGLGDITYSGSGTSRVGYSAGTTISTTQANNNDGQLATTLAVYKFVNTNYAPKTHNHTSSQISDSISTAAGITTDATGLAQGKAVRLYINSLGLGDASKKGVATSITASEAGLTPGLLVYSYAAPKTHTHTSAEISDAISTVADPSANSTFSKVVKTESAWGQISATLIPIDNDSITLMSDQALQVPTSWLYNTLDGRYLKQATAASTYLNRSTVNATAWTSGQGYSVGQLVFEGQSIWRCIQANTASTLNAPGGAGNLIPGANNTYDYAYWVPVKVEVSSRYETTLTRTTSATTYNITHNLGSQYVDVSLYDSSNQEVFAAVTATSANVVQIAFGAALASGTETYHVVVRK